MSGRRGFTLFEVLISMAITAMIMTTVIQVLDGTRRAVDAIHNLVETESTGPRILDQIRQDLSRLAVYDTAEYRLLKGDSEVIFGVEADRLDFVVYAPSKVPFQLPGERVEVRAPMNEVGYRLRPNPMRKDFLELYRREDPMLDDRPQNDGSFTLLYDRVVSFDARYAAEPELSPVWKDDWDSEIEEALPFAIEVVLEIEVQPRRSVESLGIMGANLARLAFEDVIVIPEETRWRFRHRIHPMRPADPAEPGTPGTGEGEGEEEVTPETSTAPSGERTEGVPSSTEGPATRGG